MTKKLNLRKDLFGRAIVFIRKYYEKTINEDFGLMLENSVLVVAVLRKIIGEDRIHQHIELEAGVSADSIKSAVELLSV